MDDKKRRGRVLIQPYQQLRFGLMFIVMNLFFASLMFSVFGYYLWDVFDTISEYFKLDTQEQMVTATKFMHPVLLGTSIFCLFIVCTLYMSAHYTHQIYGPLVSIRRFLDDILAGRKPTPIKLRASDQLHDLVDRLNLLTDVLSMPSSSSSLEAINRYIESLLEGKEPQSLNLKEGDPLKPLSEKLSKLALSIKKSR